MHRSNVAPRRRINRLIGRFGFYLALLVGATSLHIDFSRRKVHTALHYKLCAVCANVAFVASMPWCYRTFSRYLPKFQPNDSLWSLSRMASWFSRTVVLWLLASRWWRDRRLRAIALDFVAFDERYNDRPRTQHAAIEQHFDAIFYAKTFTVSILSLSVFRTAYEVTGGFSLDTIFLSLFFYCFYFILHCVQLQYFHLLWYACKQFYLLNAHLRETLQQSRLSATAVQLAAARADLRDLTFLHSRLMQLLQHLNDNNNYHMLPLLLWNLTHNVLLGFKLVRFSRLFDDAPGTDMHTWFALFNIAVIFVDQNLFLWLCDDTVCMQKETAQILKEFNALPLTDGDLKRQCELFALKLKLRQPQVNFSGMFNLNKQSALAIWAFILQHILILLQFSYKTHLRHE